MIVETTRIPCTAPNQELATTASFEEGELRLRTSSAAEPAARWDVDDLGAWESGELIAGVAPKGAVICCTYSDQFAATTAVSIVARYLRVCGVTPEVQTRPAYDRVATFIACDETSVEVEANLCKVDTAQFIGSALVAAFRVIKQLGDPARDITSVRYADEQPQPFPL